jgi:hypothetical protein
MSRHARLQGTVPVALAPAQAMGLFTASGERSWAHGWEPAFPVPVDDETRPGTVFLTEAHGPVTWVVAAHRPGRSIRYALVEPGLRAGTVEVECAPAADDTTIATVTYDMTALGEPGEHWLSAFAAGFPAFLEEWRTSIARAVAPA